MSETADWLSRSRLSAHVQSGKSLTGSLPMGRKPKAEIQPTSTSPEPDVLSQLNRRLFGLKLRAVESQRRKELQNAIQEIYRRNANNLNDAAIPFQWLEAHLAHARALLEDRYKVACEVWEMRQPKTAEFLRAFFREHVIRFLESRKSGILGEFHRLFGTVQNRPASDPVIQGGERKVERGLLEIKEDWHAKIEAEAIVLEDSQAPLLKNLKTPAVLFPAQKLFRRARDWEPKIREIAIAQIKTRLGNQATQKRICQELDKLEVPLPGEWSESKEDIRLWTDALGSPALKGRVKKMISEARYRVTENDYLVTGD